MCENAGEIGFGAIIDQPDKFNRRFWFQAAATHAGFYVDMKIQDAAGCGEHVGGIFESFDRGY